MPNIIVKIPANTFDASARSSLVKGINQAAAKAEQIPDNPNNRMLCWVVLEEIETGCWTCGASDASSVLIPVLVQIYLPSGVLDEESRAQYVVGIHQAIHQAFNNEQHQEQPRIASSCLIHEVPNGTWGVNGMLWQLHDFAEHAGYAHLQKNSA
jgi:phenylpyruvate tautomerase PptA (4-oxalocrotonate tautomerase family)